MKFVKDNLFPILCGVVVLISLALLYYPVSVKSAQLRNNMVNGIPPDGLGLNVISTIQDNLENQPVLIGDNPPINTTITPNLIKEDQQIQAQMRTQAQEVQRRFIQDNALGRVTYDLNGVVPLLGAAPMPNLLPNPSTNVTILGDFEHRYLNLFSLTDSSAWLVQLHAAAPPTPNDIQVDVDQQLASLNAATPGGLGSNQDLEQQELLQRITQQSVFNTAKSCLIYADPTSFQERAFVSSASFPQASDIYEAFVDSWLQNDVVQAIVNTNAGSQNVGQSPVKQLIHIAVGADAAFVAEPTSSSSSSGGSGPSPSVVNDTDLFVLPSGAGQGGQTPGPQIGPGGGGSGTTTTMTGRSSNGQYQVTYVAFSVVVVPWEINSLINNLYKQNNGYTVVQISTQTVDPIEALTNGYVYGKVPVVRADIMVEVLLYSDWNRKIMPAFFANMLGSQQPAVP
ncbi:MAG TPA: hypothetical protein VMG59_09660 [Phycisphaerae bacterium]|nr:hypothetical protein [Phycisphaerae bacterium]